MKLLQLRINYNGNNQAFYQVLCTRLQRYLAQRSFYRWTISRGWQNGRHFLLTFDCGAPFYNPAWRDEMIGMAEAFLAAHPSPDYDTAQYVRIQEGLSRLEGESIDCSRIEPNNTCGSVEIDAALWGQKYENLGQRWSIFEAETLLRPLLIRCWHDTGTRERFLYRLLILLACTYPPARSDMPEVNEYNGFLSFNANYRFWHYRLAAQQQERITEQFEREYEQAQPRYLDWTEELEAELADPHSAAAELARVLVDCYLRFGMMAKQEAIHARSPYPKDVVAPREQMSAFHQRLFYHDDDSVHHFTWEFSAYRWLLNIVYRNLPVLDVAPLQRQFCNFSLDRFQRAELPRIHRVRDAMLCAGMEAA